MMIRVWTYLVAALLLLSPASARADDLRVLVMLFTSADHQQLPFTNQDVVSEMEQVKAYYSRASYGLVNLSYTVTGWYVASFDSGNACIATSMDYFARSSATASGIDLALYDKLVYLTPASNCPWQGIAEQGGRNAWIHGTNRGTVIAHELGHTLGMGHARSLECNGGTCSVSEKGDIFDNMGGDGFTYYHPSSWRKSLVLRYLDNGAQPITRAVTQSGTYWIDRYEPVAGGVKALKVQRLTATSNKWYSFESLEGVNGVIVRRIENFSFNINALNRESVYLLDLDEGPERNFVLAPGQTFTRDGFSATVVSTGPTGSQLAITFNNEQPQPPGKVQLQ